MTYAKLLLPISLMIISLNSNAQFIYFKSLSEFPGADGAIVLGSDRICQKDSVKIGDVTSINGNSMTVVSVSAESPGCKNPAFPKSVAVEFKINFKSKAGINFPENYEMKKPTELERLSGRILSATSKLTRNKGFVISFSENKIELDPQVLASRTAEALRASLENAVTKNSRKASISGSSAWQFEVHGKVKGIFGPNMVYLLTVIEGETELLQIIFYTPESTFESDFEEISSLLKNISGLRNQQASPASSQPVIAPSQQLNLNDSKLPKSATEIGVMLKELSKLLSDGLITKEEYNEKRVNLLRNL